MYEKPRNTRSPTRATSLLGITPEATEEEVKDYEPTEEENGDQGHKPYNTQQKVYCVQSVVDQPFICLPPTGSGQGLKKSGRPDSNRRPLGPQPSALPDCATSRRVARNHTR
jgi:hypothetical protein